MKHRPAAPQHVSAPQVIWLQICLVNTLTHWKHVARCKQLRGAFVRKGARCSSVVRAFAHGAKGRRIDPSWCCPSSYFSFHDWCNKGCGMCYPVCGMMHITEPLLLIRNSVPCGGNRFPLSLCKWSFSIILTPYIRKYNVLSVILNNKKYLFSERSMAMTSAKGQSIFVHRCGPSF